MNSFDAFCEDLLEESKRFLEKSKAEKNQNGVKAYQHSCLLLAICSLEAYINGISEEVCLSPNFPIQIKGALLEKELRLEKGDFVISNSLRMSRLTDRIEILYKRYTRTELTDAESWWKMIKHGIDLRNKITHSKEESIISNDLLTKILQSILDCLSALYKAIYKRKFPKSNLQLNSKFDF